jgi:hypothetical protein
MASRMPSSNITKLMGTGAQNTAQANDRYIPSANKRETGERERKRRGSWAAAFGARLTVHGGRIGAPIGEQGIHSGPDAGRALLLQMRVRAAGAPVQPGVARAAAHNSGLPRLVTSCNGVSSNSQNFSRMCSSSARSSARAALFALGPTAKFDDLSCGRVHVFSQRHGALMFHGGEPRHNQIR